ncbi:MAG: RHS repeat-associated core domain-containing protein [Verrucomicrobia bacterium]|nr:RHS repeat-associated core domain-containing protein [Verrucomicrobiota bacterium]
MTTSKSYDYLNRLQQISSAASASGVSPVTFNYAYNDAGQRTKRTETDASYWVYQYDSLGQVVSGKKYWNDGTPVPGQQFEYGFDDIGNRTSTKAGGDSVGSALRSASYSANTLNQYTSRDVPNAFDVLGASHATNSVTINTSPADYRRGEYFQELVSVVNSSTSVWQRVAVTNTGGSWSTGNVFVAKTAEAYTYDADGNLTSDGRWTYAWDAENRLINMTSGSSTPTGSKFKMDFAYDWKGRRIEKQVSTNNGSGYFAQYTNRFVYDGWNLLAVLAPNSQLQSCFIWGLDLSGSMQGAGGVGGLLAVKDATNGVHFCAYDGNGNVAALLNADGSGLTAQYEYGPFGEVLRSTGTMARTNQFRFSTKYQDDESDMLYYGFRSYNPSTGRWLSRDPVEHESPYAFSKNNPACKADILGLAAIDTVHLMMEKAVMNTFSASAWTTGLPEFLMREWRLVSRIKAQYGTPGKGKNALWLPASDTMVVGGAKDNHNPVTIVHEMTHAVQDLELNYPFNNERMEEGEAYAIQAYYELGVRLTIDEGKYRRSECRVDRIKSLWQTFWKQFGVVPGEWGMVSWSEGGEPLQFSDLRAANERFKVRLSCSKLADEVNTILGRR